MYCTLNDVKTRLNITSAKYDDQIRQHIETASDWINQYCHYGNVPAPFRIQSDTTRYYGYADIDGKYLYTDVPFISITSVTNGDGSSLASSKYRLEPRNNSPYHCIRLNTDTYWLFDDSDSEITLVGKFGYSAETPPPVVEACTHMTVWLQQRYQAGLNTSSATSDFGEVKQVMTVPSHVKSQLSLYSNRWVRG